MNNLNSERVEFQNFNKKSDKSEESIQMLGGRERMFSEEISSVPEEGWEMMEHRDESMEIETQHDGSNLSSSIMDSSFQEIQTKL